jgi:hypothetical protein
MHGTILALLLPVLQIPAAPAPSRDVAAAQRAARGRARAALAPGWVDEPAALDPESRGALQLATDGKGHYFAFRPQWEEKVLFAGDAKALYLQRIRSSSAMGRTEFDYGFWEPRAAEPWQASFGVKDAVPYVQCGERPTPLRLVPAAEARELLGGAKLLAPRWRRVAFALALDSDGTYYFVDRLREPEDTRDFRLYVGARGKLRVLEVRDALLGEDGKVFVTAAGRLAFSRVDGKNAVEWIQGQRRTRLSTVDIDSQAGFVYTDLGVYAGEKLGTACDWAH